MGIVRNLRQRASFIKCFFGPPIKFLCFMHVTRSYIGNPVFNWGPSMTPTLHLSGNLTLVERISPRLGKVRTGDIVLVRSPVVPRKVVTKRVVGMEGDKVTYVVDPKNSDRCETIVVPKGHIWVEGDNIYNSNDSRNFGAVPYSLLDGRVFWRIWPFEDFGPLSPKPKQVIRPSSELLDHSRNNRNGN